VIVRGSTDPACEYDRLFLQESPRRKGERTHERLAKFITCEMGLQISCSHNIEISQPCNIRRAKAKDRGGLQESYADRKGRDTRGYAMPDHVHLLISIPPKFSVSNTIGFIKGKSAIRIHRDLLKLKKMTG
jgi:hypothetical protein